MIIVHLLEAGAAAPPLSAQDPPTLPAAILSRLQRNYKRRLNRCPVLVFLRERQWELSTRLSTDETLDKGKRQSLRHKLNCVAQSIQRHKQYIWRDLLFHASLDIVEGGV